MPGNAAVTGFSGAVPPIEIAPGVDPAELTFIDENGFALRIIDLRHMSGPPAAQLVGAPKPHTWLAKDIGQVFGVAVDDATAPNIYVTASSVYGLPIVAPGPDGQPRHVAIGAEKAAFMPGLWGTASQDGGPGSIWKIDGTTGKVSLLANVMLDGRANSGAALGGIAYDAHSKSLFVADRESGMIHRFDLNGEDRGHFDHGVDGRQALGLAPVAFDPQKHLDITSPRFDSRLPATWHYAAPGRRVFGLAVFDGRLYYAVAEGLQIWSVSLAPDGSFGTDPRIELVVPAGSGPTEISKITFDEQGRMFLAERPDPTGALDFEALTHEGVGRVLRYASVHIGPDGRRIWQATPDEYAIGFPRALRNGNGGVAIGYRYDPRGNLATASCGGFLWTTGEDLRATKDQALVKYLDQSGPPNVDGLQGNETWRIRRGDEPPREAYFIDFDDKFDDLGARGHMGDVAIPRTCSSLPAPEEQIFPKPGHEPPGHGNPPPPPGKCPPNTPCPPGTCPPGQAWGRHSGECGQCGRPNVVINGVCCSPADITANGACVSNNPGCPQGQTPVGPSGACCPANEIYSSASGAQACCATPLVNGQCGPPPPPPPGQSGCPSGYVPAGGTCCLASQVTSNGVCCPAGKIPTGPNKGQCETMIPIPIGGGACCTNGQIPVGVSGGCCAPAFVTTLGVCCSQPVDPNNRTSCPATTQSIIKCAPGYVHMPDGSCCEKSHVSADGKSCTAPRRPFAPGGDCRKLGPNIIFDPDDPRACKTCPAGLVADEDHMACRGGSVPGGGTPPSGNCADQGPNFIRDPNDPKHCIACPHGRMANDTLTACIVGQAPKGHLPPRLANCAARGALFIRSPRNPAVCIRCPRGLAANRAHTSCIRAFYHPLPTYGGYGGYGGYRGGFRPWQPFIPGGGMGPGPGGLRR